MLAIPGGLRLLWACLSLTEEILSSHDVSERIPHVRRDTVHTRSCFTEHWADV